MASKKLKYPTPEQICDLRSDIQDHYGMDKTEAIDLCAKLVYTSRRNWQHWERSERKMHPAFWELANIKVKAVMDELE